MDELKKQEKIVFFTFHNWKTKRQGGFHKFAEIFAEKGYYVYFFSSSRPLYSYFKNDERLNREVLLSLNRGVIYKIGSGTLKNITIPTLDLPGVFKRRVSHFIDFFFLRTAIKNKIRFFKKEFAGVETFVFESSLGLLYYDIIHKLFPNAKIIYRPSDPLLANLNNNPLILDIEKKIVREANKVILVNQNSFDIYNKNIPDFPSYKNIVMLSNGVDLESYKKKYHVPESLQGKKNKVLYVGARDPEWDLIVDVANRDKAIYYFIICPEKPNENFIAYMKENDNIIYIPGIFPEQVPEYVTNADVMIVPNPKDRYKIKKWGLTAKYLQAMAAGKPIVAFHDDENLAEFGIKITYEPEKFFSEILNALDNKEAIYELNFLERDWNFIQEKFYNIVTNG